MAYPNGKKTYGELDLQERWEWHSGVYAFRHVVLDQSIVAGTSPPDPEGKWFDRQMIDREVVKLRAKRARPTGSAVEDGRREGVAALNAFARDKGFDTWDAAFDSGVTYGDAIKWAVAGKNPATGSTRNWDYFQPTADELANARAALGLSATEAATPQPAQPTEGALL